MSPQVELAFSPLLAVALQSAEEFIFKEAEQMSTAEDPPNFRDVPVEHLLRGEGPGEASSIEFVLVLELFSNGRRL